MLTIRPGMIQRGVDLLMCEVLSLCGFLCEHIFECETAPGGLLEELLRLLLCCGMVDDLDEVVLPCLGVELVGV